MDIQQVNEKLRAHQGTVVISETTLTPAVGDFLRSFYDGQAITISDAKLADGSGPAGEIRIDGVSTFLNVPDLPVSARFDLDRDGAVRAILRYRLRDLAPGPAAWVFSRSFPKLPPVTDYLDRLANRPFLDSLDFFDTYFVVSTHAGKDPETGLPIEPGINFVSKLRPLGMLGVLEHIVGDALSIPIYGTIRVAKPTERTIELAPLEHPWDRPASEVPGIHLKAALGSACQLGKMSLDKTLFRVYSPTSTEWLAQNPSFQPVHGYTGAILVPSASVEINLGADLQWNMPRAFLYGNVEGVSLKKLDDLLDLAGSDGLTAQLPKELQKGVDALSGLSLMYVAVDLSVAGLVPSVTGVYFKLGFPGMKWNVWGDDLVVEGLSCRFGISDPFGMTSGATLASRISVTVFGTLQIEGFPLSIQASNEDGFTIRARTEERLLLPLDKLLKAHGPGLPSPGPLSIDYLGVNARVGQSYAMSMLIADDPPWTIGLGKKGRDQLVIRDVVMNLAKETNKPVTGSFAGVLAFDDDLVLQASYDLPGDFIIRSTFPRVNLTRLIDRLCDAKVPLPKGFDIVLENASIMIKKRNDDYTLQLATGVKDFGLFAFEARNIAGRGYGFAVGMSLGSAGLSKLPGLSGLKSIEDSFQLEKLMLVLSSFEDASFTFPDMAQFNRPQLATGKLSLPAQASGVLQGMMLFAEWKLDEKSREQSLLKNLLGLSGTLSATLAIGADPMKDFRLYVAQRGTIQNQPFQYKLGIEMTNGKPAFFLTGTLTVKIQNKPQTFDVTTAFVPGGAFMSASMKGALAIDCGSFNLSNVGLQIGVSWGGIPSLGLCATIDTKRFSSSVAVFFDSSQPSRSLIAGSVTNLTAKDVLDTFVGGNLKTPIDEVLKSISIKGTQQFTIAGDLADELDGIVCDKIAAGFAEAKQTIPGSTQQLAIVQKKKGASWHLTDLTKMRHYQLEKKGDKIQVEIAPQLYFAPQATAIGAITFPQGYYLNAAISFCGFDASATIEIMANKGFSVDSEMDKIVLVDEKVFSIMAAQGGGGPKVSISTFSRPAQPVEAFRSPHFYVNGALTMMGLKQSVLASVSASGVDIELKGALVPGVNFDVDVRFGKGGLGASGTLTIGVGTIDLGTLGKAKINTRLELDIDIDLDNDTKPAAKPVAAATLKEASLSPGQSFGQGKTLLDNGLITLVFQADGNLVLYKKNGAPIWASGSQGKGGTRVDFQTDGNLVIYNGSNKAVWSTGTHNKGVTSLVAQTDGNLVIYDGGRKSKWDTNTNGRVSPGDFDDGDDGSARFSDASLPLGKSFGPGATLLDNGLAYLVFQGDGNLCLYKKGGEYLWGTSTAGKGAKRVDLQADGNLVVFDGANKPVWSSSTGGKGALSLVLQTDGNLVMYDGGRNPKWASNTGGKCDPSDAPGIKLEAGFTFAGKYINLGKFHVDVTPDTFTRLPKLVEKKVEKALRNELKDMTKWANAVGNGVMEGVNDTERVFKDVYGKSEKEAKELANDVSKNFNVATKALENAGKDVGKDLNRTTNKYGRKLKFW